MLRIKLPKRMFSLSFVAGVIFVRMFTLFKLIVFKPIAEICLYLTIFVGVIIVSDGLFHSKS